MHNVAFRRPDERTLVAKFLLAHRTHAQLGHEKMPRLIVDLLLVRLQMFRVVQPLQDLRFALPLQMMVQGDFEKVLDRFQRNVVRQDLQHRVRVDLFGVLLHNGQDGVDVGFEAARVQLQVAVGRGGWGCEDGFDEGDVHVGAFWIIAVIRFVAVLDGLVEVAEQLDEDGENLFVFA